MPEDRARASFWTIVALVIAGVLLALLVVLIRRGVFAPQPPELGPQSSAPSAAATPQFAEWLKFETNSIAANALARDSFVDAVLGHQVFQIPPSGLPSTQAQSLLLEDDELLLPSGRRLWNKELLHEPGLSGRFCYLHSSFCLKELFDTEFFADSKPLVIYQNQYRIERYPSHTKIEYLFGSVNITERKFITYDDRAIASYDARSADQKPHTVDIEVTAPYFTMPRATSDPAYPLLGAGSYQGIPLFAYLDAPGFSRSNTAGIHLRRSLDVAADKPSATVQVAVSFENQARSQPVTEVLGDDLFAQHQRDYNRWFADNVPYFDSSDAGFKKMWYYRWWVVRFNLVEANTPDLRGHSFYEGKLGFDNAITFAVPVQLKELSYLRDPTFGFEQAQNAYRNRSPSGAIVDPPGSPYWGETYSHWSAAAVAELNRVHPFPKEALDALLPAMAGDVRAWMATYDADGDALPQRSAPRVTGYDLDILSFWYFSGNKLDLRAPLIDLERVDFASFVYANARAVAELARIAGDQALSAELDATADRIRTAVLDNLWDDETKFFYPQRASDDARIPVRELHGFFPFTMLLAPDEPRYIAALEKFVDPDEFWSLYPPVITSQYHYRQWTWEMDGLTRNIAPHPITMGARTLIQALKHYHHHAVTPRHFMELMRRYNALVYPRVNPFDELWRPNAHEYYSKWEPHQVSSLPKPSEISHDFHSAYCYLVVEGAVGLTPRTDDKIELQPAARDWTYFMLHRLRYHGKDLTIVWDQPDGQVRYPTFPEGFSLYIDGQQAFTRDRLGHVLYDPQAGTVQALDTTAQAP